MSASWSPEQIIDQRGSDEEHVEWMQRGWEKGYAKAFDDVVWILSRIDPDLTLREALALLRKEEEAQGR